MHQNLTQGEIAEHKCEAKTRFDQLTEQARQGDFQAFQKRQEILSRDPVDLGVEWEQFQKGEL